MNKFANDKPDIDNEVRFVCDRINSILREGERCWFSACSPFFPDSLIVKCVNPKHLPICPNFKMYPEKG